MATFAAAFASIAAVLFVAELTDKDALLLITLAGKWKAGAVFLAGSTAFVITTTIFVTLGSLISTLVPIPWVKLAGGSIMVAYALWEAKGLVGKELVEREEREMEGRSGGWRVFLSMVAALALLDIAGDATEVLTIVFVAQYSDPILVFAAACTGLIAATAAETALGNRMGRLLTPVRVRYVSLVVFLTLGGLIIFSTLA